MSSHESIDATLAAVDAPVPTGQGRSGHRPRLGRPGWAYALRRALKEFSVDNGPYLSAMLTHFTVLSLSPILLAIFSVASLILTRNAETVASLVADLTTRYVPADYRGLVVGLVSMITGSATGGAIALLIALATAVWSASGYVTAFSHCLNTLYGRAEGRGMLRLTVTMLLVSLVTLSGVVLILLSLALNAPLVSGLLGPVAEPLGLTAQLDFLLTTFLPIWAWVKWLVVLVLVIALVAVLFYFTPNVQKPRFTWLSPGSVVAIIGIAAAGGLLWTYLTRFAGYSLYGAVSAGIALLFALWLINTMLLLGAEVDVELERARELQAGIEAESMIQLPPRSTAKAEKMKQSRDRLESRGRELRLSHPQGDPTDDSDASPPTGTEGSDQGGTRRESSEDSAEA
ncbi:YihY/virulence factor BrkB family protein [Raineyella antarctica]|uniref:YihY/virulence factor BrkB family protein n=1 Tax=Raineyella antarctica TaxID=1577474 RepID=UPI000B874C84|nr:YihY/virulence factor BrkB family protein [Raineyella antarctica]